VSFGQGAALGVPYCTAYRALFQRAHARPGETVLVHGATGGVGIACVELAHARGLTVIGSGGTDAGLKAVREHGADFVVNHRQEKYTDDIMKATGGRGVDLIVEMAAHVNLDRDLGLLAKHGRVVVVGNRGRTEIDARQAMGRDAAILGMTLFNATEAELVEIHAGLIAGLANGTLNPVAGREIPLAEASRAHEAVMESGALGKIVLIP
jgi:NADPH2:quinone reductase